MNTTGKPGIDLGFQTRADALVAALLLSPILLFTQPCDNASIAADERLDGQGELIDVPVVQRQAKIFQRHGRVPEQFMIHLLGRACHLRLPAALRGARRKRPCPSQVRSPLATQGMNPSLTISRAVFSASAQLPGST